MKNWFNTQKSLNVIHYINRIKNKTYDHLKHAEKVTDKIQCTENKNSHPEN